MRRHRYTLLYIKRAKHLTAWLPMAVIVLLTAMLAACDVHEFPDEGDHMPVTLHLSFDETMTDWNITTLTTESRVPPTRAYNPPPGTMRYTVRLYPVAANRQGAGNVAPLREYTFTRDVNGDYDTDLNLDVAPGTYAIKVWADFLTDGASFYNISDFHEISLQGTHTGNTDSRDAFRGNDTLTVEGTIDEPMTTYKTVAMRRPMAKFEFVSTDLQEFLAKEAQNQRRRNAQEKAGSIVSPEAVNVDLNDFRIVFRYEGYMPNTYNIFSDRPIDSEMGITFYGQLDRLSDDEISLGFDYVFVGQQEGSVTVTAVLYNSDGDVVSLADPVVVPLYRDVHTIVRGKFLTQSASGGMTIDPTFNGDYNIVVP